MKAIQFLPILLSLLLFSCEKEPDRCRSQFPVTTTGAMTISCKIDGKPWSTCTENNDGITNGGNKYIYWDNIQGHNYMEVNGFRYINDIKEQLQIILSPAREGEFYYGTGGYFRFSAYEGSEFNADYTGRYGLDSSKPYLIKVNHFDEQKRIISGEFNGTVYEPEGKVSYIITEGQFDMKF